MANKIVGLLEINESLNTFIENWLDEKIPDEEFMFQFENYTELGDDRNIVEVNYLVSKGVYGLDE